MRTWVVLFGIALIALIALIAAEICARVPETPEPTFAVRKQAFTTSPGVAECCGYDPNGACNWWSAVGCP